MDTQPALHVSPAKNHHPFTRRDFRVIAALMSLTWALAWTVRDPFIADWDCFDYTACVVQGTPSPLGLGRALFLAVNRALWLTAHHAFGLGPENAYAIIKYGVILQSGLATAGLYALYRELTGDRTAALWATLLLTLSPLYVLYSGRGMTEIPGLLLLSWSLCWLLRGLRRGSFPTYLAAATLFGLSANVREFAVFYLPIVAIAGWAPGQAHGWARRRICLATLLAVLAMLSGPLYWALAWPEYYLPALRTWYALSAAERAEYPVTIRNLWLLLGYAFICAPFAFVIFPAACRACIRHFRRDPAMIVAASLAILGFLSIVILLANHDLSVNPRYLLTGWFGLAPLCGGWLAAWHENHPWRARGWMTGLFLALTLAGLAGMWLFLARAQWPQTYAARDYARQIQPLPDNAVFIVGRRTPLVNFYQRIGARPGWQTIPFGAGWPDQQLETTLDEHLRAGRPLYVDFDESLWDKTMRPHSREAAGLQQIRDRYELRAVTGTLFQVMEK
ncbi:MAG: glycosyltransferase family 39 protein [Blastocatellia bacterium]